MLFLYIHADDFQMNFANSKARQRWHILYLKVKENYNILRFYDLVNVLTEGDLDLNLDNAEAGPIQFE